MSAATPAQTIPAPEAPAQLFSALCAALIFTFFAITLIADEVGSALFFVLALVGLVAAFYPAQQEPVPREVKLVFFAMGLFFFVALMSYVITDGSEHGYKRLGRYARFLLVIPLYYILRRARPNIGALWWGVCLGAIIAGLAAMDQTWWQLWYAQSGRASGSVHPIIFGNMSLLLAALSLATVSFFSRIHRALIIVPLLAATMGMCGSFLSGSRGGWLAIPALAIVFSWYERDRLKLWQLSVLGVVFAAICATVWYAPQSGVRVRIETATNEVSAYFSEHNATTSVGSRLEMWKAAWIVFQQHPVLGVGMGGFAVQKQALIDAGKLDPAVASFLHPHNEYAAALATRGVIGFISLLLLFGVIGKVFYDVSRRREPTAQLMGFAGLIVVVSFAHFGISGDTFDRSLSITFFTFLVATLATLAPTLPRATSHKRTRSLSVTVITKNEADRIDACLAPVSGWADEIIVLDSGSTDNTVDIARHYAARVEVTDWPGFGPQKQRALERAQCEWVLSIDADERVTPELRAEIDFLLSGNPAAVGYRIPWQVMSHGKVLDFGRSGRAPLRLFRREGARFTDAQVHEHVVLPAGNIGRLRGRLIHDSHRNLRHALDKFAHYAWLWAQQRHAKGRRSSVPGAFLHGLWMFTAIYFFRLGLLDGRRGFLMAVLFAQYTFNKHAALWTLGVAAKSENSAATAPQDGA